jgi:NUMOD4 motif
VSEIAERWQPVPGWTAYEASDRGQIRSVPRLTGNGRRHGGMVLRQRVDRKGYRTVTLTQGGRRRTVRVHVLVMLAFAGPPPPGKPQVRHLNGRPADNRWPQNLAYGDQADQEADKASAVARQGRSRRRREVLNGKFRTTERRSNLQQGSRALAPVSAAPGPVQHESPRPAETPVFPQAATGRATGSDTAVQQGGDAR